MFSKKLFVGAAVMALALSTAAVAYAASPQNGDSLSGAQYQKSISINGEEGFSFDNVDKNDLPEGVFYQDEISMDVEGGIALK